MAYENAPVACSGCGGPFSGPDMFRGLHASGWFCAEACREVADLQARVLMLPPAVLRLLRGAINAELLLREPEEAGGPQDKRRASDADDVFGAVVAVGRKYECAFAPLGIAKRDRQWPAFREGAGALRRYVDVAFARKTHIERLRVYEFVLDLLYHWMLGAGVPFTVRGVAGNVGKVPWLVDRHFPGYRASGLLGMVVEHVPA